MFKKYYKQANDDIKTNRELINKIFDEAEKPVASIGKAKIYKFGMAAVAVLVLGVSVAMYSMLGGDNTTVDKSSTVAGTSEENKRENNPNVGIQPIKSDFQDEKENSSEGDTALAYIEDEDKSQGNENKLDIGSEISEIQISQNEESEPVKAENKIEPIDSIGTENSDTTEPDNTGAVLAMETGEAQGFSIDNEENGRNIENSKEVQQGVNVVSLDDISDISDEEYEFLNNMLVSCFGEKDEETGNEYIFEIVGKTDSVYLGRWRWWVDDHSSLLTEFVVSIDMSGMYECSFTEDGNIQWSTENNLLY